MAYANPELFTALSNDLPVGFLRSLNSGVPGVYSEAYEMAYTSAVISEPEAEYLMPHNRRAIFETFFRAQALTNGLQAVSQPNIRLTAKYSVVKAGKFYITASYVSEPGKFVRPAHFRGKHAALNRYLSQQRIEIFDTPDVLQGEEDGIYCILLHGPDKNNKTQLGFMEFAFPNKNNTDWVDTFKFSDVLAASEQRLIIPMADNAKPKLKKQRKRGGES